MQQYLAEYTYLVFNQEIEEAVKQHLIQNGQGLNDSDRKVLEIIKQHSFQNGSAHLSHFAIGEAIGKSNATVRRSIRKLERLKIIDRTHYVRPGMNGLGANIYSIKPSGRKLNVKPHDIEGSVLYKQLTLNLVFDEN